MRVIIAGSRDITALAPVGSAVLLCSVPITEVVSGGARGVDHTGEMWAAMMGLPVKRFPADWARYGKRAGRLRNSSMAEYADALVAVWDGKSPGTKHMIESMEFRGKPVFIHRVP